MFSLWKVEQLIAFSFREFPHQFLFNIENPQHPISRAYFVLQSLTFKVWQTGAMIFKNQVIELGEESRSEPNPSLSIQFN